MATVTERLYRQCIPVPEAGCWLWTGAVGGPMGYGSFTLRTGVSRSAHRVSWEVHRGEIPDGMFVCHKCDTPSCVNPDHLFLGSHADNMRDCQSKGRNVFGSRVPMAKLNEAQVGQILSTRASGREMADRYGVSTSEISLIRTGQHWKHVVAERPESYYPLPPESKTCTRCQQNKPISGFQARPTRPNGQGVYSICKGCKRDMARQRRESK